MAGPRCDPRRSRAGRGLLQRRLQGQPQRPGTPRRAASEPLLPRAPLPRPRTPRGSALSLPTTPCPDWRTAPRVRTPPSGDDGYGPHGDRCGGTCCQTAWLRTATISTRALSHSRSQALNRVSHHENNVMNCSRLLFAPEHVCSVCWCASACRQGFGANSERGVRMKSIMYM